MTVLKEITKKALELKFDEVGVANLKDIPNQKRDLFAYLSKGFHGEMLWLEKNKERRAHPIMIWENTKSVLVLTKNYGPDQNPLLNIKKKSKANISVYARGDDYHDIMKVRLRDLSLWIKEIYNIDTRYFVDTAPIMEKPIAQIAGLGWQGKHTNLVSRKFGSWLFLSVLLLPVELNSTKTEKDHCGSCKSCIDVCPTNAIVAPHKLDARKCISYLTIEFKGIVPREMRKHIGNRVYGCDDCLSVCPWNKFAQENNEIRLKSRDDFDMPDLSSFIDLDEGGFADLFSNSPIKRIGRDRFIRNILIGMGNSEEKKYIPLISNKLRDKSSIVRATAIWAIKQLCSSTEMEYFKTKSIKSEKDKLVLKEWN
tara:strand:- start:20604 stop:21707 length:1104 start_codon:yes stop_codon:yes gene_type:complete